MSERVVVDAVAVTSIERTLSDLAAAGEPSMVRAAAQEALARGLTTPRRLQRALGPGDPARTLLAELLRR